MELTCLMFKLNKATFSVCALSCRMMMYRTGRDNNYVLYRRRRCVEGKMFLIRLLLLKSQPIEC